MSIYHWSINVEELHEYNKPIFICFKAYTPPILSDWHCYLFGSQEGNGMVWQPVEGQEPNWFWRKMQYLVFGHRWVKNENL